MSENLSEQERLVLSHLNARRFELLLIAAQFEDSFTAQELKAVAPTQSSTSLTRDLNALEAAGLLVATPSASEPRQGRPVVFRIAPGASALFAQLAQRVADSIMRSRSS